MRNKKAEMTITKCLKKIIILGQIFGYFPVQDISKPAQTFSYKSLRVLFSFFSITGAIFLCIMQINKASNRKPDVSQIDYVVKYLSAAYVAITFLTLARRWPKMMATWRNVEIEMGDYGFPRKLNRRIGILIGVFMTAFLVEYFLHQASRIYRALECHEDKSKSLKFFLGNLSLSHVFRYIPYNIPTSLVFQYWFCQMEFAFTYTDLFVMVISMCLASRMEQVTKRINMACQKQITEQHVWTNLRKDYTRVGNLTQYINDNISNIILVSFVPNVFTILTQVFSTLKPKQNFLEAIYFYFSLVFLISRTATVCICGAMVYEESRKPLIAVNSIPFYIYNNEIEIFINQLLNFEISMNGKHFFKIKRSLILEIAGAIVSYELVLIQFNRESLNSWSRSTRCE